jgi:hypothetical protein
MHMDSENFDAVRKLMALKRHESPPPGFYSKLPGKIAARIERGECQLTIWERVSSNFVLRPAFAYAFAVAAFGAFSASIYYSGQAKDQEAQAPEGRETAWANAVPGAAAFASQNEFAPVLHVPNWMGNTNPAAPAQELPSLFSPQARAVRVSYDPSN